MCRLLCTLEARPDVRQLPFKRICGKSQTFISYEDALKIHHKHLKYNHTILGCSRFVHSSSDSILGENIKIDVYLTSSQIFSIAERRLLTFRFSWRWILFNAPTMRFTIQFNMKCKAEINTTVPKMFPASYYTFVLWNGLIFLQDSVLWFHRQIC